MLGDLVCNYRHFALQYSTSENTHVFIMDLVISTFHSLSSNNRMTESSGYGSNSSTLTPLGSGPTPSSPQSTMGQSPNNGYHLNQQQHHLRHVS